MEPATQFAATTLLLVARDGESVRRQVASPEWAFAFCRRHQLPCYDATLVGYPQRMRDYQRARQRRPSAEAPAPGPSREQLAAIMTLETAAGAEPVGENPDPQTLADLYRRARIQVHPDRTGGDRSRWDRVEAAARTLGLV